MLPLVVAAVLAAAVLHAGWNAIAKAIADRLALTARIGVVCVAAAASGIWWVAAPTKESWPWLGASVAVHLAYNLVLITAYRLGDFNQAYPIARGLGPLVVTAVAVLVLGERLAPFPAAGVVLIAGAVALIGLTPWRQVRANRPAVAAAAGTGLSIATYTLIDGVGVRRSGSPIGYTLWLVGLQGLLTLAVIVAARRARRTGPVVTRSAAAWSVAGVAGVMSIVAYGLVLWSQTHGALATVAALRESSVIVAAGIGVLFFEEPMGRMRVLASVAVATGVVLLAVPAS